MEEKNEKSVKAKQNEEKENQTKKIVKEEKNRTSVNEKKYVSYFNRVLIYALSLLLCFILATIFMSNAVTTKKDQFITYKETSNLDYKVNLKKNDFYEQKYLGKDMIYVASLIDTIDIDFNYIFDIEKKSDISFDYDITGKLVISDTNGQNTFYEKEYDLSKTKKESINAKKSHKINEKISIDYDKYNNLANKFRTNYGIDTTSNLIVSLNVHKKGSDKNEYKLDNKSAVSVTIPLSEKAINIKIDRNDINNSSQLFTSSSVTIDNYAYLLISIVFIILLPVFMFPLVGLLLSMETNKSTYDKYINKILNEYDRLIVETTTAPDIENKNIIRIDSFNELLDVRDNLSLPIKYYIITKHQKCNFYINHNDELYLLTIKAVDIEKNSK